MLTRQQSSLLDYLVSCEDTLAPSFEEMRQALGLKSKSGVHRLVCALEDRGFVRRIGHRARAIEVLRRPGAHPRSDLEQRVADIADTGFNDLGAYQRALQALVSLAQQHGFQITPSAPCCQAEV